MQIVGILLKIIKNADVHLTILLFGVPEKCRYHTIRNPSLGVLSFNCRSISESGEGMDQ